ncbi:MAG TPA: RsmB/NOP family class I SAM-dependent RNA methyltransferase [archaeon]|nr:RsmB/NOP family class I SAM-dependent RNA methyltransferase [archaeon]
MAELQFPKKFVERYGKIVDDEKAFFECLQARLPRAFRVNNLKAEKSQVLKNLEQKGIEFQKVPWYEDAFVTNSLDIGNTIDHFIGYIYIQELVSMLPALLAAKEIKSAQLVLDAAAAPGSKTTHLADLMGNKGCIIANDRDFWRIKALKFNLEKLGVLNTIITNQDFRFFGVNKKGGLEEPWFPNFVLMDAPCSSEGTVRKDPDVLARWSEKNIFGMARLQQQMVLKGFDLLTPGGSMVYSTCTFAPEENEEIIQFLLEKREDVKIEKCELSGFRFGTGLEKWGEREFDSQIQNCCRVWPHHNNTGGFFLTKVRKVE